MSLKQSLKEQKDNKLNYKDHLKKGKSKIAVWGSGYIGLSTMAFFSKNKIKTPKKTYGLISQNEKWVDIDYQEDLMKLNFYLKQMTNKKKFLNFKSLFQK